MNIASFILPKGDVAYLHDKMTLRQGLEKLKRSGYAAIPVLDEQDRYVGVISEGDFLWTVLDKGQDMEKHEIKRMPLKALEDICIRDIVDRDRIRPVCIDTDMEQLLGQAQMQNFVPVVDDRSVFVGIITRRDIISYFVKKQLDSVR